MFYKLGAKLLSGPGLGLVGCAAGAGVAFGTRLPVRLLAETSSNPAGTIYQFSAKDIDGNDVDMSRYRGQVCVVVNVASRWGKTKANYSQLVQLYNKYNKTENKLAILAFPCNQFGAQEPGTNSNIKKFADGFGVQFDMFEKIDVNGNNSHPLWVFLKEKQGGLFGIDAIKWNFTKFIINKDGEPVARLGPMDDPIPKVEEEIKKYL